VYVIIEANQQGRCGNAVVEMAQPLHGGLADIPAPQNARDAERRRGERAKGREARHVGLEKAVRQAEDRRDRGGVCGPGVGEHDGYLTCVRAAGRVALFRRDLAIVDRFCADR
jgi:hypothetical protein